MIPLPTGIKIWLVAGITDMRNGFNGLAAKVQTALKDEPMSGHVFIFRGRSGSQVKLLWSTGDGLCLLTKRLERGRFAPAVSSRWQSVPDPGAAGNAAGRHRLATAEAVADLPDHAVGFFILVVAE
ncbi:IS66 family insertion sequence element accessory protein TnpB [Klebsiella pneumoniae]|uniref:IS66 family insertion sequence element accessory protein TnpB n=1 Tax=Klebsiella pneumoniae TaxID=573 RepID=A0A927HIB1_KLEPN|nr:IS66 family insertion sequence element accessory protein TnpB [Klebsiella pneumoniae]